MATLPFFPEVEKKVASTRTDGRGTVGEHDVMRLPVNRR